MLFYNSLANFGGDALIVSAFGIHEGNRPVATKFQAFDFSAMKLLALFFQCSELLAEATPRFGRDFGFTVRSRAKQNVALGCQAHFIAEFALELGLTEIGHED